MAACGGGDTPRDPGTEDIDGAPPSVLSTWETGANPGWGSRTSGGDSVFSSEAMAPSAGEMSSLARSGGGIGVTVPDGPLVQIQLEPGVLTAGTFDDHLNLAAFDQYLNEVAPQTQASLPLEARALIRVTAPSGAPVDNAHVIVRSGDEELLNATTASDGRALFVPSIDGAGAGGEYRVTVTHGEVQFAGGYTLDAAPWDVKIDVEPESPKALDLAFVVDATGSMSDELEFLKTETIAIATDIKAKFPRVDIRFGLIVYRDAGDLYVTRGYGFADLDGFVEHLTKQRADGGGDYPEAMHKALQEAAQKLPWRDGYVARIAFLMADAPPHDDKVADTFTAVKALRKGGVRIYPVAASGVADVAEYVMRTSAFLTLGRYLFLTDDSAVGNAHAEPRVPCYDVEKLQAAIVRMVNSELAGKLLPPDADGIIRSVGKSVDGVCQVSEQADDS